MTQRESTALPRNGAYISKWAWVHVTFLTPMSAVCPVLFSGHLDQYPGVDNAQLRFHNVPGRVVEVKR